MKLRINGKDEQITLKKLMDAFGPGSDFEKKNGYCIDFAKPLVFRLSNEFFKPDTLNPGLILTPRTYTVQTKFFYNDGGRDIEIRYFEREGTHTHNNVTRVVLEPPFLQIRDGKMTIDLSGKDNQPKNFAKAYFMLSNPNLGSKFVYFNPDVEAKRALQTLLNSNRLRSMLIDPVYPNYIDDESIKQIAKRAEIPGSDTMPSPSIRTALIAFSESKEPKKGVANLLRLIDGSKEIDFVAAVRDAMDYGVIHYDVSTNSVYYLEESKNPEIRICKPDNLIVTLRDHEKGDSTAAFARWLINEDKSENMILIRHRLNTIKDTLRASQAAGKNVSLKFSVDMVAE